MAGAIKTVKVSGTFFDDSKVDAKLWPLNRNEAENLPSEVKKCNDHWWLSTAYDTLACVYYMYQEGSYIDFKFVDGWCGVRPALKLDLSQVSFSSKTFTPPLSVTGLNVTITPGENMTRTETSGNESQLYLHGAMTPVVYTADDGYYFPPDYSVSAVNGISVARNDYTQITVFGTPINDHAAITLTSPTAKTKPDPPETVSVVDCTTIANNDGKLTGVTADMEYKKSDAEDWTDGTDSGDITGLVPGTY